MRRVAISILLGAACLAASASHAQCKPKIVPGWHIAERAARIAVLVPTLGDMRGAQEAAKKQEKYEMKIGVGEAVVAFARKDDVTYCIESSGRISAIRGRGALSPAKPGAPAFLTKDFQIGDRTLRQSSTLWVLGQNPGGERATVQLDRDRTQDVPSAAIRLLSQVLADATADKEWLRAK